jgi:hypothetical protein
MLAGSIAGSHAKSGERRIHTFSDLRRGVAEDYGESCRTTNAMPSPHEVNGPAGR